jgi:hypothetical protein
MQRVHLDHVEFELEQAPLLRWSWLGPLLGGLALVVAPLGPAPTALLWIVLGLAWATSLIAVRPIARVRVGATRIEVEGWIGSGLPWPDRRSLDLATAQVQWTGGTLEVRGPEGSLLLPTVASEARERRALIERVRERRPAARSRHGAGEREIPVALRRARR